VVDLGGGRRLWRHGAGSIISRKKRRERSSLRVANESRFTWSSMDEYGNVSDEADSPTRRQFAV